MADYAQIYCTVMEVINDLGLSGDEPSLLARVREASATLQREIGDFIPVTEKRTYFPPRSARRSGILRIDPLLSATTVENDDTVLVAGDDYELLPPDKEWANGPYSGIRLESGCWGDEAEITGPWGKYNLTEDTGIVGTQATAVITTLAVTNGALLSPGMVVLLGTEQELVIAGNGGPDSPIATAATSKLNGAMDADDEEMTVDNGAEFSAGEVVQVGTEDIYLVKRATHTWVVKRGWNGTTKASHLDDSVMGVYRTFTMKRGVNGTTAAIHAAAVIYRYLVPEELNYMCRQVAALMRMKAKTGFSGRAGGGETGEAYFVNEFPRKIADLKRDYRTAW